MAAPFGRHMKYKDFYDMSGQSMSGHFFSGKYVAEAADRCAAGREYNLPADGL